MIEVGWWPGDRDKDGAAFYAFAHPAPEGYSDAGLDPVAARWDTDLGEFVLDWEDVCQSLDPRADSLAFLHSAFGHAWEACEWDPLLASSAEGHPPPIH
jgi:Family of unknown function (DUF5996)